MTGFWSNKAADEIGKYCNVTTVYDEKDLVDSDDFVFTYYCENETVMGFEFRDGLEFSPSNHFLVCDMCSILGSKHVDVSKFGIIFSSLSKNLGISGSSLIIIRNDILNRKKEETIPTVFNWNSFRNVNIPKVTPSFMSVYITGINLKRMIDNGGLKYYHDLSLLKSKTFYDYIDNSEFYINDIPKTNRSRTNITFSVNGSDYLSTLFTKEASENGFVGTKHHRANPQKGCRISLYNGLELEELEEFIKFMEIFRKEFTLESTFVVPIEAS